LIWNPGFKYISKRPAYLKGFARRFWNKSADHRGTHEYFGLVACLLDSRDLPNGSHAECEVDGVLYEVDGDDLDMVLGILDIREKYGYELTVTLAFDTVTDASFGECFVYCACIFDPSINVFFGPFSDIHNTPEELESIAHRIQRAVGPSGRNIDYLLHLHESLLSYGFIDTHVSSLVYLCKQFENR
jgi:glutathione-specific gamma-glutamylcyclotransferase